MNRSLSCVCKKSSKNHQKQAKTNTQNFLTISDDERRNDQQENNNPIILIQESPQKVIDLDANLADNSKNDVLSTPAKTKNHEMSFQVNPLNFGKHTKNYADLRMIREGKIWVQAYNKRFRSEEIINVEDFRRSSQNDEYFIEIVNLVEESNNQEKMHERKQKQREELIGVEKLKSGGKSEREERLRRKTRN